MAVAYLHTICLWKSNDPASPSNTANGCDGFEGKISGRKTGCQFYFSFFERSLKADRNDRCVFMALASKPIGIIVKRFCGSDPALSVSTEGRMLWQNAFEASSKNIFGDDWR